MAFNETVDSIFFKPHRAMENYSAYIDSETVTVKAEFSGTVLKEADLNLSADGLNEALSLLAGQEGGKLSLGREKLERYLGQDPGPSPD